MAMLFQRERERVWGKEQSPRHALVHVEFQSLNDAFALSPLQAELEHSGLFVISELLANILTLQNLS